MSNLTETVCFKVSKETKEFLNGLDNSSKFVRELILRSMELGNELESITSIETMDGQEYIAYEEEKLEKIADRLSKSVMREVFTHSLNKNKDK